MSEPAGVLFQNADSRVISYPEIFNSVGLMGGGVQKYAIYKAPW